MSELLLRKLPNYECIARAAARFPVIDLSACQSFLHVIRAGAEAFNVNVRYMLKEGLSPGGFMVLMFLLDMADERQGRSPTPAELADLAGVTRATMTGLIDTLERDGFVERKADPVDRRKALLHLTPAGRSVLDRLLPDHFRRIADFMKPLSENERQVLVAILKKLIQGAEERDSGRLGAGIKGGCTH